MSKVWLWPKYGPTTDLMDSSWKSYFIFKAQNPIPVPSVSLYPTQMLWAEMLPCLPSRQKQTSSSNNMWINSFWFLSHFTGHSSRQDNTRFTCTFFSTWGISPLLVYMKPCYMHPLHHPHPQKINPIPLQCHFLKTWSKNHEPFTLIWSLKRKAKLDGR